MRIPIQQAINSKQRYICVVKAEEWDNRHEYKFEIKITSFEKIDLRAARKDEYAYERLDSLISQMGSSNLWILNLEFTNLDKETMTGYPIIESFFIKDSESFRFPVCTHDFVSLSDFAEKAKTRVFSTVGDVPLLPKVATEGGMPFLLPKDVQTRYYLSLEGKVTAKTENEVETKIEHDNGWIYVLTNPTFQRSLLKIGVTQRTPEKRAFEISTKTGLPKPFNVSFKIEVAKCKKVEKVIHDKLAKYRYAANREFFELPLEKVVPFIKKVAAYFPKEKVPDPEELKKQERINQIKEQIKHLTEELGDLEKK